MTRSMGRYTAWAVADSHCDIAESNEANNTASRAYTLVPELELTSFSAAVTAPNTTAYSITVTNRGTAVVGQFRLSLWYDLAAAPTCSSTGFPSPDFRVVRVTASVSGSDVTYTTTICNQGAYTAVPFGVGLAFDGSAAPTCATTFHQTWNLPGLSGPPASSSCMTLTYTRAGVSPGAYEAWVMADAACALTETDENNNTGSFSYAVAPTQPDLYATSFTATITGNSVTFAATICNQGVATSTTSTRRSTTTRARYRAARRRGRGTSTTRRPPASPRAPAPASPMSARTSRRETTRPTSSLTGAA